MPRRHQGYRVAERGTKEPFDIDDIVGFLDSHPVSAPMSTSTLDVDPIDSIVTEKSFLGRPLLNGGDVVDAIHKTGFSRYMLTGGGAIVVPVLHPNIMSKLPEGSSVDLEKELASLQGQHEKFNKHLKLQTKGLERMWQAGRRHEVRLLVVGQLGEEIDIVQEHLRPTARIVPARRHVVIARGISHRENADVVMQGLRDASLPHLLHFGELAIMAYDEPE